MSNEHNARLVREALSDGKWHRALEIAMKHPHLEVEAVEWELQIMERGGIVERTDGPRVMWRIRERNA